MTKNNDRMSNIELLRIIAVIMILISHFSIATSMNNVSLNNPLIINDFFTKAFALGGISNHIFIIISGYFLVNANFKLNKVISLILQLLFYSLLFYGISYIIDARAFDLVGFVKSFFSIFFGQWFIIYYIILYLISPALNKLINNIDKRTFTNYLISAVVIFYLIPTLSCNMWKFDWHILFIVDYFIGTYINKCVDLSNKKKMINISLIIVSVIAFVLMIGTFVIGKVLSSDFIISNTNYYIAAPYSIFAVIIGCLMFLKFLYKKPFYNSLINSISKSSLAVYLIHQNAYVAPYIWNCNFLPNNIFVSHWYYIFFMIFKCLIIYVACVAIDKIRVLLFGKIENKISIVISNVIIKIHSLFVSFFEGVL